MPIFENLAHLSLANRELVLERDRLQRELLAEPARFAYWKPCTVRVLIVADGLTFATTDGFGLSTFVTTLFDTGWHVKFLITLGHLNDVGVDSPTMMAGDGRVAGRITNFKFDDKAHFAADKFDVVFLFGIATSFSRGAGYPADSLSNPELQALAEFQNRGGGLFATGDHAALGRALCHRVARVRNMRLWQSTPNQLGEDMVSMTGRYRNDSNRIGHDAGSQFDDQSDDIPQHISPVLYTRRSGLFRYSYPHPLLCGPKGPIRVMPDHPHEGECRRPENTELDLSYTAPLGPEYPPAIDGGPRPVPEIISYNDVLSGTTSDGKSPTVAQSFPGVCAYDGHRAGVGRAVTDATWHHFVNVNLTGIPTKPEGDPKRLGFLASAEGQAHFEQIKAYYRNLAVWLSPAARIRCMQSRLLWYVVWEERVLEAVLTARGVGIEKIGAGTLSLIGRHARDVLARFAGQCQSMRLILDLIEVNDPLIPEIDPWRGVEGKLDLDDDELPLVDMAPLLNAALGGALVAISEQFVQPTPELLNKLKGEEVFEVARKGAAVAHERANASFRRTIEKVNALQRWKVTSEAQEAPQS